MWFSSLVQGIKSTLKSEDTEGFFEIYVTRSCGYLWALLDRKSTRLNSSFYHIRGLVGVYVLL